MTAEDARTKLKSLASPEAAKAATRFFKTGPGQYGEGDTFRGGDSGAVYQRFREKGRMLPDGLRYVDSWVEVTGARCFQVMECDDVRLFDEWVARWNDLVEFEIVPVRTSKEAAATS